MEISEPICNLSLYKVDKGTFKNVSVKALRRRLQMKISFTAEFPLLLHHSSCVEVSQLSPSMLLSEKMQRDCYADNEIKKCVQFKLN